MRSFASRVTFGLVGSTLLVLLAACGSSESGPESPDLTAADAALPPVRDAGANGDGDRDAAKPDADAGADASTACPNAGELRCNGTCVDPKTDEGFCGATGDCKGANAGKACVAGEACTSGACTSICTTDQKFCSGACRNVKTDAEYCGDCNTKCPAGPANTVPSCTDGACGVVCAAGFYDCNGDLKTMGSDGCEAAVATGCTYDFAYTGAEEPWTVPAGITSLAVTLEGAQGGSSYAANTNYGGKLEATLAVTPGDVLHLYVGGQPTGTAGGFNGGGNGESGGRGGGGATDVRRGGNALADRVLVAGGGGGAGFWSGSNTEVVGGKGGGLSGEGGYRAPNDPGGQPGTQSGSGTGTCVTFDNPAMSGGLGFGGSPSSCGCDGYGGGGGYYGGAGSGNCRGGGGGSAFTAAAGVTDVVHTVGGAQPGNGRIRIHFKP